MTSSIPKPPQRIRVEMPTEIVPQPVPEALLETTSPTEELPEPAEPATSSKVHVSHPKKADEEQPKPIAVEAETPVAEPETSAATAEEIAPAPAEGETNTVFAEPDVSEQSTPITNEAEAPATEQIEAEIPTEVGTTTSVFGVPSDEELYKRQYYTIGEVADMFGANQSQIRFWENEFEILQPKKNKKGDRYFRPEDVKNLVLIRHLLQERRFTIEGAKEYLKGKAKRLSDRHEAIQQLEKLKGFLQEMKANLAGTAS